MPRPMNVSGSAGKPPWLKPPLVSGATGKPTVFWTITEKGNASVRMVSLAMDTSLVSVRISQP